MFSDRVMFSKLVVFSKAHLGITFKELGKVTLFKDAALEKLRELGAEE